MSTFHFSRSLDHEAGMEVARPPQRERRQQGTSAAGLGFPSPAREDLPFAGSEEVSLDCLALTLDERHQNDTTHLADALPRPAATRTLTTDTTVSSYDLNLPDPGSAALVEGTLTASDLSLLTTSPATKTSHNLRLPSFHALGIAAPHPDNRIASGSHSTFLFSPIGAGPLSQPEDPLHAHDERLARPALTSNTSPWEQARARRASLRRLSRESHPPLVAPFTPPAEAGQLDWSKVTNVRAIAMDSPPTDAESQPSTSGLVRGSRDPLSSSSMPVSTDGLHFSQPELGRPWVLDVLAALGDATDGLRGFPHTYKILSHALPSPSVEGHSFPAVIDAICQRAPATTTTWINVFHALPGKFQLSDLPTSPPTTPGPAIGGDDYFTTRVFDSAVRIDSYESRSHPAHPSTAVAPGTVDLAFVERYIPPTNAYEFQDIFSTTRKSLLHDRLLELTSDHGTLVLIYPTKTGALTFKKDYLGPILEPLLRSTCIIHGIPLEAGEKVAAMSAIDRMLEFSVFRTRLLAFCEALNDGSPTNERNHGPGTKFSVTYAATHEVHLNQDVWASHWYTKQEKPRIAEVMTGFFTKGMKPKKLADEHETTASNLVKEVLDRVSKGQYPNGEPTSGIEVGVYVVKKSPPQ